MQDQLRDTSDSQFPIVGIGASAGGLEAIRLFLKGVPQKSGMAYVFVQHLSAGHESALQHILSNDSRIPIVEIKDHILLEPDVFYIAPPNKVLTLAEGEFKLEARNEKSRRINTIDVFFSSLGLVHQSFAVGVVLSGTMDDGTVGLKVIKANGGITMVQNETAAYDGMPQNAIKSGAADFVLPPEKMVEKLIEINMLFNDDLFRLPTSKNTSIGDADIFRQILNYLKIQTGVDFTHYKKNAVVRRLQGRIAVTRSGKAFDYLNLLRENILERNTLFNDLLIGVTEFFRDDKTFDFLVDNIFPNLLKTKEADAPIRIWVAGCSSGEEAYSIAICLDKVMDNTIPGRTLKEKRVQIFGTDLSEIAIAKARSGIYNKRDIKKISPEDLEHYFLKTGGGYQVNNSIRECCVFARHNLLHDPPFWRMDLVSCRNLLRYLEPVLQQKVLSVLHYSLTEKGMLLLGRSETVETNNEVFEPYHSEERIYIKKGDTNGFMNVGSISKERVFVPQAKTTPPSQSSEAALDISKKADEILLSRFTPAGVLVNEDFDIVQFRGSTGQWLTPSPGKPSFNIMKMARQGLSFELRNLLTLARTKHTHAKKEGILFQLDGSDQYVTIEAIPVYDVEPHYLVLFQNVGSYSTVAVTESDRIEKINPYKSRVEQLEKELAQIREDVRAITENQEATNEELQSANEELLSGSEELQATNEELESAKEELQSTNEELISLNHELFERYEELNKSKKYTDGIFATIRDPLIVVDHEFKILMATFGFYKKFGLTEKDTEGKSLFYLHNKQWDIPELKKYLENISPENISFSDFEFIQVFPLIGERTLVLNARQLELTGGRKTILISIEDITDRRKVQQGVIALKRLNADLVRSNLELEQFAAIASHDLQEPLRKIITFVNIVIEKNVDIPASAQPYINKIAAAAQRMANIIKDLLDYARINGIDQSFLSTDLNEVIKKVVNDLEIVIQEKAAVIKIKELPEVPAVGLYMGQLFYNLLNNGLKFSKKDVPSVIEVYAQTPDSKELVKHGELNPQGHYTEIIVRDNGIGFNAKYAEQVFRLFQRINTQEEYPGTGIGLALCRKIALLHGGKIYVESTENVGTSFHVLLPLELVVQK